MQELDILLLRYLETGYVRASADTQVLFGELLGSQDPELVRYLLAGELHPDPATASLIAAIRATHRTVVTNW